MNGRGNGADGGERQETGHSLPVLVRPMPDGSYQMMSSMGRKFASELAELPTVPRIVRELTDDEAIYSKIENIPRSVAPKITFKYFESI